MDQVRAEEEEAIIFLAKIIPKKGKKWIRREIESIGRSDFMFRHELFLGLKTRNALRAGGFVHLPEPMDFWWAVWLEQAVNLPKDRIILTDFTKERIKQYRATVRRPPLRPKLDPMEIEEAVTWLEQRHSIKLPIVEVRYTDRITGAFAISATEHFRKLPTWRKAEFWKQLTPRLKLKGLQEDEMRGITPSKFTIFLPRRYPSYPAGMYIATWHELGHAMANAFGVKDKKYKESIAMAFGFIGLFLKVKEGKLSLGKACDQIELDIKSVAASLPVFEPYREALNVVREYNPELSFRNRDPDELVAELEKSVQYATSMDREVRVTARKRQLSEFETPFILTLAITAVALLIISFMLSLF